MNGRPQAVSDGHDCPQCHAALHAEFTEVGLRDNLGSSITNHEGRWYVRSTACSTCDTLLVYVRSVIRGREPRDILVWPTPMPRVDLPEGVPGHFADDLNEAFLVLEASPRASAALGRRCLQRVLREKAHATPGELNAEIDEVIGFRSLPAGLCSMLDATRVLGKFVTHPQKSTACGLILPVEPGEAEWLIDVIVGLLRFYFAPARSDGRARSGGETRADGATEDLTSRMMPESGDAAFAGSDRRGKRGAW